LDDSSNKRLSIPELFLAVDGCLHLVSNIASGLVVYPMTVQMAVNAELPFMATEEILMAAVRGGADRQKVHEIIRRHSQAAGLRVKREGCPNDLMDRLAGEPEFSNINLKNLLDPRQFVGRAPEQVDLFIREVVGPIRARYKGQIANKAELRV
jgi:adenylosuccinate lyase